MQKFPTISLDGAYEMALLMHSEYTALQMEINSMQSMKEHGAETFPAVVLEILNWICSVLERFQTHFILAISSICRSLNMLMCFIPEFFVIPSQMRTLHRFY